MRKEEKLLKSIGSIDEKFIEEANSKMKRSRKEKPLWKKVASFVIILGLALFLFLPVNNNKINTSAYKDSEYHELIEALEPYRASATALPYDNNFKAFLCTVFDHPLKFGPIVGLGRQCPVNVCSHDLNTMPLSIRFVLTNLRINGFLTLRIRGIPRINNASHIYTPICLVLCI